MIRLDPFYFPAPDLARTVNLATLSLLAAGADPRYAVWDAGPSYQAPPGPLWSVLRVAAPLRSSDDALDWREFFDRAAVATFGHNRAKARFSNYRYLARRAARVAGLDGAKLYDFEQTVQTLALWRRTKDTAPL